jgi:hypothetical protein
MAQFVREDRLAQLCISALFTAALLRAQTQPATARITPEDLESVCRDQASGSVGSGYLLWVRRHEFTKPEDRIDVWSHQQAFLRRYLQSPVGLGSTSIDEIDLNLQR